MSETQAANGHIAHNHDNRPAPAPPAAMASKKGKQKKATEPNEASKLIAARISQLELDAAGEKDQEAEIGALKPAFPALCAAGSEMESSAGALGDRVLDLE